MEHLNFALTISQLHLFCEDGADVTSLLSNLFVRGSSNYQQLAYELQREFTQGGSPDVTGLQFDRVKYNNITHEGRFRIVLDINFTFGCEDVITEKEGQTSEWTFAVDLTNHTINFYSSPFAESRSTADEF